MGEHLGIPGAVHHPLTNLPPLPPFPPLQVLFSEGQAAAVITLSVVADGVPEGPEHVTVALMDVTTVGLEEPAQAATIAPGRAHALLTILANGSPYGVVGWHMDSLFPGVQEPAGETPPRRRRYAHVWISWFNTSSRHSRAASGDLRRVTQWRSSPVGRDVFGGCVHLQQQL